MADGPVLPLGATRRLAAEVPLLRAGFTGGRVLPSGPEASGGRRAGPAGRGSTSTESSGAAPGRAAQG